MWNLIGTRLHKVPTGIPLLGFSDDWVCEELNPKGIRECYLHHNKWISAKWIDNVANKVPIDDSAPTHYMLHPMNPREITEDRELTFNDYRATAVAACDLMRVAIKCKDDTRVLAAQAILEDINMDWTGLTDRHDLWVELNDQGCNILGESE